ncbi:MAG: thioredoxin [Anaerolineae bacterium]
MGASIPITDATFEAEVLRAPGLVITDFWAEWCAPCVRIAPILEELATEYAGKLKVTKLDVESNPLTPGKYQITAIPTLLVFRDGQLVDTIVGFQPKDRLLSRLKPLL